MRVEAYPVDDLEKAFGPCTADQPWMDIYYVHHFVKHLMQTLPATLNRPRPADEKSCQIYARKLIILLNAINSTEEWHQTMHFAIFLKTKILRRRSNRWTCLDYLNQHPLLSFTIWNAIRQGPTSTHIKFWDFASAWRELWADWQTWDIFERIHISAQKHRGLLMVVHQVAVAEVQMQCRIALQRRRLPSELVLLITEHTLVASGIPISRSGIANG